MLGILHCPAVNCMALEWNLWYAANIGAVSPQGKQKGGMRKEEKSWVSVGFVPTASGTVQCCSKYCE